MDRAFAVIAVATAFLLLAASAERSVGRQTAPLGTTATSKLELPPAAHHQRPAAAHQDAATMATGERLPFVAARHLPAASTPLPWAVSSEAEAGELGPRGRGKELVRQSQRPSYMGDGTTTSQEQEQLAMKATSLLPAGASDVAKAEPAKTAAADTVEEELPELLNPDE